MAAHSGFESFVKIAQGDGPSERDGSRITVTGLTIRGRCILDRNSNAAWNELVAGSLIFRVIVYVDTQANGDSPTYGEFFDDALVNQDAFDAYNNLHAQGRFKTLMDKYIHVKASDPVYDGNNYHTAGCEVPFKKTIKNLSIPITYSDATANMASVRTNNIGMWVLAVGGGATTSKTAQRLFAYRVRVRFVDF